jgi:hypothetical protein
MRVQFPPERRCQRISTTLSRGPALQSFVAGEFSAEEVYEVEIRDPPVGTAVEIKWAW